MTASSPQHGDSPMLIVACDPWSDFGVSLLMISQECRTTPTVVDQLPSVAVPGIVETPQGLGCHRSRCLSHSLRTIGALMCMAPTHHRDWPEAGQACRSPVWCAGRSELDLVRQRLAAVAGVGALDSEAQARQR